MKIMQFFKWLPKPIKTIWLNEEVDKHIVHRKAHGGNTAYFKTHYDLSDGRVLEIGFRYDGVMVWREAKN